MPVPNLPNDELVAIAWIGWMPGITTSIVATQLPEPANKDGSAADWVIKPPYGFVTVAVVGGGEDPELPIYRPVLQVDCWATKPGSNKPPWFRANRMAQAISAATRDRHPLNRRLPIPPTAPASP